MKYSLTKAVKVDNVPDNMPPVQLASLNLEAAINTNGRGLVVRPFLVNGIETAIVCIVQEAQVTDIENSPEEVQIRARLVPMFMLMVPEQNFKIEALPMEGEREMISTRVDHDANVSSETGHS